MKAIKYTVQSIAALLTVLCAAVMATVAVEAVRLPDAFNVVEGTPLVVKSGLPVQAEYRESRSSGTVESRRLSADRYTAELKLFGVFPIKSADVRVIDELYVRPSGESFGIKLFTNGVVVVGLSSVETAEGSARPAQAAGIQINDNILSVDGEAVHSNEAVAELISKSEGRTLCVRLIRNGQAHTLWLAPAKCKSDGAYKAGMWVRDSSAGIGTMTFYSPATGIAAGLGHGICDVDTGELLPLSSGEMVEAKISAVEKSVSGAPGELKGSLTGNRIGEVLLNSATGIYGSFAWDGSDSGLLPVAMKQEVKTGAAEILSTIDGGTVQRFTCELEKVRLDPDEQTQNLVIRITDGRLLARCGGIVQGMSGSPILQNGKLVGAVTHVFVGDPERGYGILAENMLNTAQSVAQQSAR